MGRVDSWGDVRGRPLGSGRSLPPLPLTARTARWPSLSHDLNAGRARADSQRAGRAWTVLGPPAVGTAHRCMSVPHEVRWIATSDPRELPPGTVFAGGNMWVAHGGTGGLG